MDKQSVTEKLRLLREKSPIVLNVTNYVVMNNTANALLAVGASPIMANAIEEMEEMVSISSAVVLNMGTISKEWLEAMLRAGSVAKKLGKPMVFDPVGVGATTYRKQCALQIIEACSPTVIRGNASEIMTLDNVSVAAKGVDSTDNSSVALTAAKNLAKKYHAIVVISGPTDYITDGVTMETVPYGNEIMKRVTGLGCTATALVGAFLSVVPNPLEAAIVAMTVMGMAGEKAAKISRGNGSMQVNFLDELYNF